MSFNSETLQHNRANRTRNTMEIASGSQSQPTQTEMTPMRDGEEEGGGTHLGRGTCRWFVLVGAEALSLQKNSKYI